MKNLLLLFVAIISFSACDKETSISNSSTSINLVGTSWFIQTIEATNHDFYQENNLTNGQSDLYISYENSFGKVLCSEITFLNTEYFDVNDRGLEIHYTLDGNILKFFKNKDAVLPLAIFEISMEGENLIFLYDNLKITHFPM